MKFSINASGKPAEVRAQLQKQLASAQREHPRMVAVGGAISDAVSADLVGAGVDDLVTIAATVDLSVTVTSEPQAIKAALETVAERRGPVAGVLSADIAQKSAAPVALVTETTPNSGS